MSSLRDIINLCTEQDGKVFVVNDHGDVQFVLLSREKFEDLNGKTKQKPVLLPDPEVVNKQILKAQLENLAEDITVLKNDLPVKFTNNILAKPEVIPEPFNPKPPRVDLREEVIDPSFDFDSAL